MFRMKGEIKEVQRICGAERECQCEDVTLPVFLSLHCKSKFESEMKLNLKCLVSRLLLRDEPIKSGEPLCFLNYSR